MSPGRRALPPVEDLVGRLGVDGVLLDDDRRAGFETDWTRRWTGRCDAVVRPRDTSDVAFVLQWCSMQGVDVVPQGGNTGLVGGSIPPGSHDRPVIVISLRGLDHVEPLDAISGQITVGAGVTLARLCDALSRSGWEPGVDLGARESATLGGMAATNAGGTRVVRHGMMRRNVVGLECVLADGSVVTRLNGLEKDNTGYDLCSLMVGSEGTLGVITRVRLRLVPTRAERTTVLVTCAGWRDAVELSRDLRRIDGIEALEAVDAPTARIVRSETGAGPDLDGPCVALVAEWAGDGEAPSRLVDAVGERPHRVATDSTGRAALWWARDRATESIARRGVPHKLDVTLPLDRLAAFVGEAERLVADAGHHVLFFGHLGDGNLHVNVLGPADDDSAIDTAVLELVARSGGSISAEHGIGRAKLPHLHLARSPAEITAFRGLKHALDPQGLLNPGVILP